MVKTHNLLGNQLSVIQCLLITVDRFLYAPAMMTIFMVKFLFNQVASWFAIVLLLLLRTD